MTPADAQRVDSLSPGWVFPHWSVDQAARTLLLLGIPADQEQTVQMLFDNADVGELIALYQSLPLLPNSKSYCAQAVNGVRSSMTTVFNAIALRNPYPADYFDQSAWNQMVLKALFEDSPLFLIEGLDRRANPELARMLSDYAHERWAANRPVSPELWRPVGPFAEADIVADLERVLNQPDPVQQQAAALACAHSPAAQRLLNDRPDLRQRVQSGQLTWESFGESFGNSGKEKFNVE
ncbi:EboA domain-containing protein [Vasconcelosia minhoensis]|uniref:EboA domain-containing protein n=1 Tax=Vasconcelosia minhoensis TaxID=3366354 RepID=UPI0036F24A64